MTDEQAADRYWISLPGTDPISVIEPAFLAGAAYKAAQMQEREAHLLAKVADLAGGLNPDSTAKWIAELKSVEQWTSDAVNAAVKAERERIAPLEARLAWAEDLVQSARPIIKQLSLDYAPEDTKREQSWLSSYAAGPTEEGKK